MYLSNKKISFGCVLFLCYDYIQTHMEIIIIIIITEKSRGDLRRLAVTQTPGKNHRLTLM